MLQKRIADKGHKYVPYQCSIFYKWRLMLIIASGLGLFILSGSAIAGTVEGYAGANIGFAMGKFDKGSFDFKTDDLNRNEAAWRLFAGGRLHKNVGLEAGYIDFRTARVTENVYNDYFETALSGFDVTAVGWLPVGKYFLASVRAGIIVWSSDMTTQSAILGTTTKSESGSGAALGVGGNYDIGKWIRLRAEYMRYGVDKYEAGAGDFNVITISAIFVFYR